jgi:ATP dependent DNA ligase domain
VKSFRELALSTEYGFSFDGLVNRLRVTGPRIARAAQSPAIYIVFDMLADAASLLDLPFRLRRKTLEQFFRSHVKQSSPLYLSASTEDLSEVEKWIGHIGQQLDGIIAKRANAPYRPGDDHSTVKIKNYRSADCVIDGFRDHSIGSARNELLLGVYDQKGHLQYVGAVGIDTKQKQQVGNLRSKKITTFYGRQPGQKSHFRHECTFLRVRRDKLAKDCLLEQVFQQTVIHDISAFIEAGLATTGGNRK